MGSSFWFHPSERQGWKQACILQFILKHPAAGHHDHHTAVESPRHLAMRTPAGRGWKSLHKHTIHRALLDGLRVMYAADAGHGESRTFTAGSRRVSITHLVFRDVQRQRKSREERGRDISRANALLEAPHIPESLRGVSWLDTLPLGCLTRRTIRIFTRVWTTWVVP